MKRDDPARENVPWKIVLIPTRTIKTKIKKCKIIDSIPYSEHAALKILNDVIGSYDFMKKNINI